MIPRALSPDTPGRPALEGAAASAGLSAALLLVGVVAGRLVHQVGLFRDPFVPLRDDLSLLLLRTTWGHAWIVQLVAVLVALVGFGFARRAARREGAGTAWWVAGSGAVALALTPAFSGHAFGSDRLTVLAVAADSLHLLSAGLWLGGLAVLLLVAGCRGELPRLIDAFSPLALASVGVLIATGSFAAWLHIPELDAVPGTPYGRALLVKVAFAASTFLLGAWNWRRVRPGLHEADGPGRLRRTAAVELALGQAVLIATAVVVSSSPP